MFEGDVSSLSLADLLMSAGEHQVDRYRREARLLWHAVCFADLTILETGTRGDGSAAEAGRERMMVYGGAGCPAIPEFAAAEFGAVLGISSGTAAHYIGQALALRHRLPFIWARVMAGEAIPWRACKIADACQSLSAEAAAIVDQRVCSVIDTITPRRLDRIVKAAVWEADPEGAQAAAEQKARERGVYVGQSDEHGTKKVWILADAGDVIAFDAGIEQIAEALKALGDTRPLDVRRAKAVGIIADPRYTEELLLEARNNLQPPPHPETTAEADAAPNQAERRPDNPPKQNRMKPGPDDWAEQNWPERVPDDWTERTWPEQEPDDWTEPNRTQKGPDDGANLDMMEPESTRTGPTPSKPRPAQHQPEPAPSGAEPAQPESMEPGARAPDGAASDGADRDSVEPDSVEPGSVEPDSVEPGSVEPDSVEPGSVESGGVLESGCVELGVGESAPGWRGTAGWEPGLDDEADREPPHSASSELADPLDVWTRPTPRVNDGNDGDTDSDAGEAVDAAAVRAFNARLAKIKLSAHAEVGAHAARGVSRPRQTEIYVHLSDQTLAGGTGVLRVENLGPMLATQLTDLVGYGPYCVKPVIDLNDNHAISVDAYEIPDRIRERVKLTYPVEQFPYGTAETSRHIDLDHIQPYDPNGPPGQTRIDNLAPLRRFTHRVKTHGDWKAERRDPTTMDWTSPHGFKFRVTPSGTRPIP